MDETFNDTFRELLQGEYELLLSNDANVAGVKCCCCCLNSMEDDDMPLLRDGEDKLTPLLLLLLLSSRLVLFFMGNKSFVMMNKLVRVVVVGMGTVCSRVCV
jgi:hypothetical protein